MRVKLVEQPEEEAKELFEMALKKFGRIPNLFKALANRPEIAKKLLLLYVTIMMEGVVERKVKEMVALKVSKMNKCDYCIKAHTKALKMLGVSEEEIEKIDSLNLLDEKEEIALRYAEKVTEDPSSLTDEEFKRVKDFFGEEGVVELTNVVCLFNYLNRFLDSLRVPFG